MVREDVVEGQASGGVLPYHLFKAEGGGSYVYFLERDCAFRIEPVTYELLERGAGKSLEEAADALAEEGQYGEAELAQSLADAKTLRAKGFFRPTTNTLSPEERERQLERRFSTPRTRLELALAESCNLACVYCYCSAVRDMPNKGLMTEDVARQAIDWLFNVCGQEKELGITLFGGEPLLNKAVFKVVMDYSDSLAKRHGKTIRYSMTTNATLLDDMVIGYIKKHNFGLMVSLDGPPELHNAQCPTQGGDGSFDLAIRGIRRLMRRRKQVTVRCTLTHGLPDLLELVRYFEGLGFTRIVLGCAGNPAAPTCVDCTETDLAEFDRQERESLRPWVFEEMHRGRRPAWFPFSRILAEEEPTPDTVKSLGMFRCGACRGTMTVGADGTLYPCHRFVGMRNFVIGHISTGPDADACRSFWRRYDEAVDNECSQCWARRRCKRPCPWEVALPDGTFRPPAQRSCERIRDGIAEGMHYSWWLRRKFPEFFEKYAPMDESVDREGNNPRKVAGGGRTKG